MPPPQRLEQLFRLLLPPASREHVLGDLHERCKSPRKYFIDAISLLGPVIISRIRRTTDVQVFLMEVVAVYMSYSGAAWYLGDRAFLFGHEGFTRLALPTIVIAATLLMCNAYADWEKPFSWIRPTLQTTLGITLALLGQTVLSYTLPSLAVPLGIMLYGSCTALVLVSSLRTLFPAIHNDLRSFGLLNQSQASQKPNLPRAKMPFRRVRQVVSKGM